MSIILVYRKKQFVHCKHIKFHSPSLDITISVMSISDQQTKAEKSIKKLIDAEVTENDKMPNV